MPKINVYLPDELASAVREAGIPVSAVCQRALADAVAAATDLPAGGFSWHPEAGKGAVVGSDRLTGRASTALDLARTAARQDDRPAGSVDLVAGLIGEGHNLALGVLGALGIEPEDVLTESRAVARNAAGPTADDLDAVLGRAAEESSRLGHTYIGCEHLLLGLATGPDTDPVATTLVTLGVQPGTCRQAVLSVLKGMEFARANGALFVLSDPVRSILDEIRQRLSRLERTQAR